MSKLQEILKNKQKEVQNLKQQSLNRSVPITWLNLNIFVCIAEIKPKSPAAGSLRTNIDYPNLAKQFVKSGVSAISVLTDSKYFGGNVTNLAMVKNSVNIPILRKDFIIHSNQVDETYNSGADIMLLIFKGLSDDLFENLLRKAISLGLQVLVEVYDKTEILNTTKILQKIKHKQNQIIIGVNNRNLDTFEVDISHSKKVFQYLPKEFPLISMSSIRSKEDIEFIKKIGYNGVLIGEGLVRNPELLG
jgi:indole-3-glycerol phosphate synthase